ncbi:MAG TPA: hypothetical protein PKJ10_05445 [Smithella sp.]|nr:hypothetical protein [Smithella sp.]
MKQSSETPAKFYLIPFVSFFITAYLAVVQKWSVQEFCWCVWLAGLFYSWTCVVTAAIQIMLTAGTNKKCYDAEAPFIQSISPEVFALAIIPVTLLAGFVALYIYCWLFSFYGLFLSVFAEMPPLDLFGRNGFINSDFFTPVTYLAERYWPMIAATLIANADDFMRRQAWERIVLPFRDNQILRIHIMTLALPFLMMLTWALFRDAYQQLTIVILIGIFFLIPKKQFRRKNIADHDSEHP